MTNLLGGLRGNVRTSSILVGKRMVDFIVAIIELFSIALMVETL